MHDIWNPWHGCVKKSEGCACCYMYFLDRLRGKNGKDIRRISKMADYLLHKNADGSFKIKSGERIRVCMTSDFFLKEADSWRDEAWEIMRRRPDVVFILITKRPERVIECLPKEKYPFDNIQLNVTAENQKRADERLPLLAGLPFEHLGVMVAPFIAPVSLAAYLKDGRIEQVCAGGENYDGSRPLRYEWVQSLAAECRRFKVNFCFMETGTTFIKDGKTYTLPDKRLQSRMAFRSGLGYVASPLEYRLSPPPLSQPDMFARDVYVPRYRESCAECGSRQICNGCSDCGKCP